MTDTLALTRESIESLRNSEKKVAKCVLTDPSAVINSSITELAERSGTSEPTVIRFCRKLGLGGYMELRLNLARDLPSSQYIFENISDSDSLAGIAGKVLNAHREAISNTLTRLSLDDLDLAVKAMQAARRIEFYGFGGSAIVARDAYHKFFRLGIHCAAHDDSHMQVMSASLLGPEDVVVVIVIDDARLALPLADAIVAGGLPCVEVTLRQARHLLPYKTWRAARTRWSAPARFLPSIRQKLSSIWEHSFSSLPV